MRLHLSRQEFIYILHQLKDFERMEQRLNDAWKQFDPEFNFVSFSKYHAAIIDILMLVMHDKENQWIEYWIYELDFGKKAKPDSVTFEGKKIPIKTASHLYDLLVNSYEKEKERIEKSEGRDAKVTKAKSGKREGGHI